ncbi:MAG: heme biosynthesis protein HemY [Halioglobus sp.]|nr:heme biosynthesis protein HemY [Halioglobus sp.]
MRTLFIFTLLALLLGVGAVALIETDPGYVLVTYGNYTLETSLWVGILLMLALMGAVFYGLRMIFSIVSGQRSLANWFGARKARDAQRQTARGLISFTEGHWSKARNQLERGAQHNEVPLANYLLAARASGELDDNDRLHEFLRAARDAYPDAAAAVEITLAEIKIDQGDYQQALAALGSTGATRHPRALELMANAYQGLADWDGLFSLLPALKKQKTLPEAQYRALEQRVHAERLAAASASTVQSTWQDMPQALRQDSGMLLAYVRRLAATGDTQTAEKTLQKALKHQWQPELVREYGLISGDDSSRRLAHAESWLSAHPEDAQLLLCLGRLSARDKLWGKARDYFESSYRLEKTPEVCAELGRLLTELGEAKVAGAYFREGLLLREKGLPELPQPERVVLQGELLTRS